MKKIFIMLVTTSILYALFLWLFQYFFTHNSWPIINDSVFKKNISEYTEIVDLFIKNNIECDIYVNKENSWCDKLSFINLSQMETLGIFSIVSFEKWVYILSIQNSKWNNSWTSYIYSEKWFWESHFWNNWKKVIQD